MHPSLIINMDQTGVNLVPSSTRTYERLGSSNVGVVGVDDKRQITVCLASSLDGDLLPLQLIFQGKTARSTPPSTPSSISSLCHVSQSKNHWSCQETMQQYITKIIMPYANKCIADHRLRADANIILVLDVWAVHKSVEFRQFLRTRHPRIKLVFVPANCTSKLQVADVALQRPFKHHIKKSFSAWAAALIRENMEDGSDTFKKSLNAKAIKPLVQQWCLDSWSALKERRELIIDGWRKCVTSLFDVNDPSSRSEAVAAVARHELEQALVPEGEEIDALGNDSEAEAHSEEEELDISQPRVFGERKGGRDRKQIRLFGYQLSSSAIAMTEDSDE